MPRWVLAFILLSGCAFSISGPPPDRPRNQIPKCDTGKGLVALDGVMATTSGIVAMAFVANDLGAAALLPLAIGAVYLGGAIHGNKAADECRVAMDEFESSIAARDTLRVIDNENEGQPYPRRAAVDAQPLPPIPVQPPPQQQPVAPPPQPQQQPPPQQPQPKAPAKQPAPKQDDDDWGDFWREVQ